MRIHINKSNRKRALLFSRRESLRKQLFLSWRTASKTRRFSGSVVPTRSTNGVAPGSTTTLSRSRTSRARGSGHLGLKVRHLGDQRMLHLLRRCGKIRPRAAPRSTMAEKQLTAATDVGLAIRSLPTEKLKSPNRDSSRRQTSTWELTGKA